AGSTSFTVIPSNPDLVAYSGGLGVALIFGIIMLLDWTSHDIAGAAAIFPVFLSQFCYGIVEGSMFFHFPRSVFKDVGMIVMLICYTVGLLVSIVWLINDVLDRYDEG
ncbi:unnamed protein product, partial [marine sediment metagenome]